MFVFLVLSMLYQIDTLTGFAKATKTCPATKRYWRPLNSKRSLPVLKWTSESEYFLSFKIFLQTLYIIYYIIQSKSDHLTPRCACAARDNYFMESSLLEPSSSISDTKHLLADVEQWLSGKLDTSLIYLVQAPANVSNPR